MKITTLSISLLILMSSCSHKEKTNHTMIPQLKVATSQAKVIPNTMEFVSRTVPTRSYIIQPRVSGYIQSINFVNGSKIKKGQLLYTIDPAPLQTQVASARASLASAQANLTQAQTTYNRNLPLSKINAISQSQMDGSTASLVSAQESVESAKAMLESARLNLGYCTITAPEAGIIAPSKVNVGDYVGAGTQYQVLTTISYSDSVTVNLSLPTVDYFRIIKESGKDSLLSDIRLILSDDSIYPQAGHYEYTEPEINSESGSVIFNVSFRNSDFLLRGGEFARVKAVVGKPKECIVVPARAVNEIQGVYSVFVVGDDNKLEFRKVDVGDVVSGEWVILSGLKAGEVVITEGFSKAKSGMEVKPKF